MERMTRGGRIMVVLFAGWLALLPAAAQTPPVLALDGRVKTPLHLTLDALKQMPATEIAVSYQTERGPVTTRFAGVLLWSLIEKAGGIADSARGAAARHTIRITATDGYVVVLSTGEVDPEFGGKAALVAYARDGKPTGEFHLVMPGDKRGGRYVHDVVTITVE